MKKNILFLFVAALIMMSFSSCGIFGKGCGCPEFGKIKQHSSSPVIARVVQKAAISKG